MKLYFSPGACSLSPHIALLEAGLPFTLEMASTKTHQLKDGTDFYTINPLGYVPVLELDNGQRLREGPAIVQYIADQAPASKLAPANGTFERYQLQEWLGFIGTEIHKGFSPLFNPNLPDTVKDMSRVHVLKRLTWVDSQLEGKEFLMGTDFTVADAYLFTVCGWSKFVGVDTSGLQNLASFMQRVGARPAVQQAIAEEKQ
ncbi:MULTISPECIES: glutathione transferase GstA [unclassified Comamonas]|jgi:glutathione S-transferase|uniref:glutathione transferase GstA n=1 Tax=Comamonas TaxID=283 RepID=UPI001EFB3E0F|nr:MULTISPECIES: glutathione transferase GstA [unclassified Comamonas]ULR88693.1 glutathione transferase GstA [Comamonas sp. B21-038]